VQVLLDAPDEKIANEIFNVGYQNMSIMDIALLVKRVVEQEFPEKGNIEIVTTPSDDNRSYHINSDKIRRILGFAPKRSIEDAVRDLCVAFRDGRLPNPMTDDIYYNVRRMKRLCAA
jgi:nucleoside-diphosphate-sugar epimerase